MSLTGRSESGERGIWSVATAKSHLSEVIERAQSDGPQTITRRGRQTAVVVSMDEWLRRTKRNGTLVEFFAASPLRGVDIDLGRMRSAPRKLDL